MLPLNPPTTPEAIREYIFLLDQMSDQLQDIENAGLTNEAEIGIAKAFHYLQLAALELDLAAGLQSRALAH
jgi:hypothetical protein